MYHFSKGIKGDVYLRETSERAAIVIKSVSAEWIFHVYLEIEKILGRSYSLSKYPFINCFTYKNKNDYYLVVFPRVVHKTNAILRQFFISNKKLFQEH